MSISNVFTIDQNYPTSNALLVPGPNQSLYTVFIFNYSDWSVGNQNPIYAIAQSGVNTDGTWKGVFDPILQTYSPVTLSESSIDNTPAAYYTVVAISSSTTVLLGLQVSAPAATAYILPVVDGGTGTATPSLIPGTNITITGAWPDQTINSSGGGGGGGGAFNDITTGDNTTATMTVGSGASIIPSGSGIIDATEVNGIPILPGSAVSTAGLIPISQGDGTAIYADPLVQGIQAVNTVISTINPVLISGSDYGGTAKQQIPKVDSSGNLYAIITGAVTVASTTITGSVAVTGTFYQATQPVSGTVAFSNTTLPVTNVGTFAVQAVLGAETTKVIGTVNQGTSPWVVSGAVTVASTTITGSVAVTNIGTFAVQAGVPALGQALATASLPVVLTAAQILTLTPPAAITGFALETGGNLATVATNTGKIPALGQALAIASVPVVLTAAQILTLTPPAVFGGVVTNAGTFATQSKITDGTNTATVKAASTAAVATDTAIVVAISPNNSLTVTGVVTATGTVAVTQSTSPWVISGAVTTSGTVTASIAASQTIAVTNAGTFAVQVSGTLSTRPGAPTTANWSLAAITVSALGANVVVAGVTGQTVRVMRMNFQNASPTTATTVTIQDTTPTSFSGAYYLSSSGSYNGTDSNGEPLFVSATGKGIQLNSSVAVQLSGTVWYTQS